MRILFLLLMTVVLSSCGKVVNSSAQNEAFTRDISFALMERQCVNGAEMPTELFKNITSLVQNAVQNSSSNLFSLGSATPFDYRHPMVVSLTSLQSEYDSVASNPSARSLDEILLLYTKAQRFEDLHCSLGTLTEKKTNDLRPYLNLVHSCLKDASGECREDEYANNSELSKNILSMCESFYSKTHCLAEFRITQRKGELSSLAQKYRQRFLVEKFDPLFRLKSDHLKFDCQKGNEESKTVMTVPVFAPAFDQRTLTDLLAYAAKKWSGGQIEINFELVSAPSSKTVQIIPTKKGISHVPTENNYLIYLSTALSVNQKAQVLAHEFGHVLGFPDCYIEFFDDSKKELVYYELSQGNMNIMCSMKPSVSVPKDYFIQLEQRSCIFR